MKCNYDCFNCKFDDCVNDEMPRKNESADAYNDIGYQYRNKKEPAERKTKESMLKGIYAYKAKHRDYYNALSREYYKKHREEILAKKREYYKKRKGNTNDL